MPAMASAAPTRPNPPGRGLPWQWLSVGVVVVTTSLLLYQWNTGQWTSVERLARRVGATPRAPSPPPPMSECYPRLFRVSVSGAWSRPSDCEQRLEQEAGRRPAQHLFFLKTHKTGSQTLATLFNRYALTHNLTVAVRKALRHHKAQNTGKWRHMLHPPPLGEDHWDMLTDHVIFNESNARHVMAGDAIYVTILREPLNQFVSAFYYFRDVWHSKDHKGLPAGQDPIMTMLSDLDRYDVPPGSPTNQRMAIDLGVDPGQLDNASYVRTSVSGLASTFHLVMITERFDESLVLLGQMLSWRLPHLLYVRQNVGSRHTYNFTAVQRAAFETHRKADYALYRHFLAVLEQKLAAQDATFPRQVSAFRWMRGLVEGHCVGGGANLTHPDLLVPATPFSHAFRVTPDNCRLLLRESSSVKDIWFEQLMLQRVRAMGRRQ